MADFLQIIQQLQIVSSAPTVPSATVAATDFGELLSKLLDTEFSFPEYGRMPFKSALARVFGQVTDLSGVRLPALSAANAVLEATTAAQEARLAAEEAQTGLQALIDAQQDAEAVLNALNDSTLSANVVALSGVLSDLSGNLRGRVDAIEAIPAYSDAAVLAKIADLSGNLRPRVGAVEGGISSLTLVVDGKLATSVHDAYVSTNNTAVASVESRVGVVETALPSKVAQADLDVYIAANDAAVGALDGRVSAAEGAVSGVDARLEAVEAAVPTKVAQADYDVFVSSTDAAVASVESRVGAAEGSISGLDSRVEAVEGELPNKALGSDLEALDARVVTVEGSFVAKLVQEDAADYAALVALGANKIGKVSSSPLALDENAATNTILFVLAGTALSITSNGSPVYEMLEGESVTLAKNETAWVGIAGIVPLSGAPASVAPPPSGATFPEAWSLLDDGGYTATLRTATLEEEEETEAELDGTVIVLDPAVPLESFRVWFEFAFGKVEAAALDGSRFYSPDFANLSLQDAAAVLVTLSLDGSDEAVNHRVPITSIEGQ